MLINLQVAPDVNLTFSHLVGAQNCLFFSFSQSPAMLQAHNRCSHLYSLKFNGSVVFLNIELLQSKH